MVQIAIKPELTLPNPDLVRSRIEALETEATLLRRFHRVLVQVTDACPAKQIESAETTASGGTNAPR